MMKELFNTVITVCVVCLFGAGLGAAIAAWFSYSVPRGAAYGAILTLVSVCGVIWWIARDAGK